MGSHSFRDFIEKLEKEGNLLRITPEVDTLDVIGALIARADYEHVNKGLLFENPKGYDIPVFANTIGATYDRIAKSFGVPLEQAVPGASQRMMEVMQSGGVPPVFVENEKAPCKEVIFTGDDIDLGAIPILRMNPKDGTKTKAFQEGRFICAVAVSKPAEDAYNLSYHRFEITGKDKGSVWIFRGTGDAKSMEEHWGAKIDDPSSTWDHDNARPFPMAYIIGSSPEMILAGANSALPYKNDDFAFVGGLTGEPVKLVKCETIDVDVPADAEIVIEGVFKPFDWAIQGRFASFNGFYDDARRRPTFQVTAITMRKKPIYQHVHIGRPLNETNNIAAFFRSVKVYQDLIKVLPNVRDVFVDPAAGCGFTVHVSIDKKRVGEAKMAMMRAYTALQGFCKHVFVYDEDIDIRNPHERDWALAHRFMADRDLLVIPNVLGMAIDPLAQAHAGATAKLGVHDGNLAIPINTRSFMGLDCTVPLGLKVMDRVLPVEEVEARVDQIWNQIDAR
ncbi:MAG: UbiD family decarboxylase [Proteobacteria bacterium]|nr:UbiD family decarboxylase [Pseudomonadota bacterium]